MGVLRMFGVTPFVFKRGSMKYLSFFFIFLMATSLLAQVKPQYSITPIPQIDVILTKPEPLPFKKPSLRFQRTNMLTKEKRNYRPIGEAILTEKNHAYLSFPKQDVIIKFEYPKNDITIYGERRQGGKDELVKNPEFLSYLNGNLITSNQKTGQVVVFDTKASFQNMFDLRYPSAIPGPNQKFLLVSTKDPNRFTRVNEQRKVEFRYQVVSTEALTNHSPLLFHILPNWDVIAVRQNLSRLFHIEPNGINTRHLSFNTTQLGSGSVTVKDVNYENNAYWLLLQHHSQAKTTSLLLIVEPNGKLKHLWECPFDADGFDMNKEILLLYNRDMASAETFRRN